jgi:NAD(P)-dependent dehydrogenase (short-subunit alcohol dehydrogenase family)
MSLTGRNILVTGANRGLGAAFVDASLDRGAERVYAAVRDPAALLGRGHDQRVVPVRLDLRAPADAEAAAGACPDVDLLVCNAAIPCMLGILDPPTDDVFRDVFEVNVFGSMNLVRAFAPVLRGRRGGIVFVLSVAAVSLSRSSPIYSATKAAGLMIALGLREQLKADGVTVSVVLPGYIDTDMSVPLTAPKAPASQVAARSLDGWLSGVPTVWPDRFSELVRDTVDTEMLRMIDEPRAVMGDVQAAFMKDPAAGR